MTPGVPLIAAALAARPPLVAQSPAAPRKTSEFVVVIDRIESLTGD